MLLVILFAFGIRTSWFQTYLAQKAAAYLSKELQTEVRIDKVDIEFLDLVNIEGVYVEDKIQDTLLYSEQILVNIGLFSLSESFLQIDEVSLTNTNAYIRKYKGDTTFNFQHIVDYFASDEEDTTESSPFAVNVDRLDLSNINFIYQDQNAKPVNYGLDYSNIHVQNMSGEFSEFALKGDSILIQIDDLQLKERSGLILSKFTAGVLYSPRLISLNQLKLGLNNTLLLSEEFNIITPNGSSDFSDFVHKVTLRGDIENSIVDLEDVALFVPTIQGMDAVLKLHNIEVDGEVYGLKLSNTHITTLNETIIKGNFQIPDMDHPEEEYFVDEIELFQTSIEDVESLKLTPFLGGDDYIRLPPTMIQAGLIRVTDAHFKGRLNDFHVDGNVTSGLGNISSEYGLRFYKKPGSDIYYYNSEKHEGYNRDIQLTNVNLGALTGSDALGFTTGYLSLAKGSRGFSLDEMKIIFSGKFQNLDLNDYSYKNIIIQKGLFANELFDGKILIKDNNLALTYDGTVDLKNDMSFNFELSIDSAHLNKLNLVDEGLAEYFQSKLVIDMQGTNLDEVRGTVSISDLRYVENEIDFELDTMLLKVERADSSDAISLESEFVDVDLSGKFDLLDISSVIQHQLAIVAGNLIDDKDISETKNEFFDLSVNMKDVNPLMQFVDTNIYVAPNSTVQANYTLLEQKLKLQFNSDLVKYQEMKFAEIKLKNYFDSLRANVQYEIGQVNLSDSLGVTNAALFSYIKNNKFSTNIGWDALGQVEPALFAFTTLVEENHDVKTDFNPSFFFLKAEKWDISRESTILWNDEVFELNDFDITNGDHIVSLQGKVSKNPKDWLYVTVRDFDLAALNGILDGSVELGGVLNIEGGVADVYDNIRFEAFSDIKGLEVEKEIVGDLIINNKWNKGTNSVTLNGNLKRGGKETFRFNGDYKPNLDKENLNIDLLFDRTDIGFLSAFEDPEMYTDIEGILDGSLKITGELTAPAINGKLNVVSAKVKVPMFNVRFGLAGVINFKPDQIVMNKMDLLDQEGNRALANVTLSHTDWGDFRYNVDLDMESPNVSKRFLAMNTVYKDGDFYYGKAYVGGNVNIRGNSEITEINVNAITREGTDLKLALYGTGDLEESSFIVYDSIVPKVDLEALNDKSAKIETTGLVMNMNFQVSRETKATIVFDPVYEDQIEVDFGEGDIDLSIDEFGEIQMFGDYTIIDGAYNMNVKGLVQRKFIIANGSKLSWTGSPYDALIDITAKYTTKTSLEPIMPIGSEDHSGEKEQVDASLIMERKLMSPLITFKIETPYAGREEKDAIKILNANKDLLSKQFFSIVALNRFLSTNGQAAEGNNAAINFAEDKINDILETFDQGLAVEIEDGGGQLDYQTTVGERITVTTSLGVVSGDESSEGGLIGDVVVEYRLNDDGTFTVNAFNESNRGTDAEKGAFTQGVGLHYEETFNTSEQFKLLQGFLNIFRKKENDVDYKKAKDNGKKVPVKGALKKLNEGEEETEEEETPNENNETPPPSENEEQEENEENEEPEQGGGNNR